LHDLANAKNVQFSKDYPEALNMEMTLQANGLLLY
jgi:hypothetical protein